jgi:hypothetical protein
LSWSTGSTDKKNWQPALDQAGNDRTDAWVINATYIIGPPPGPEERPHFPPQDHR